MKFRIIKGLASTFNPLSIIRVAGPYGPGLVSKFRKDIEMKFSHLFEDTSLMSQYIYHLNAQNPAGEVAFATLNESLGWARNPLSDRLPSLESSVSVAMLYGSKTWMDPEAGYRVAGQLGPRASFQIIDRSGHHIYVDNHGQFNDVVVKMLQNNK